MTDFGHDLWFGASLPPDAARAEAVVALAGTVEDLGLDLLAFQDHPYQPGFLDTWTLLAFLAARTSRVRLFPDVANVPLRPPAVLARAAAALDILSGGRVELGLGAGYFRDAIAAMGGPRRTAAEHVEALEEAVAVVRALWTPGPPVRLAGRYTRWREPSRARCRPIGSASGWAPTSGACSSSPAGPPTAGCPPSATPPPRTSAA